MFVARGGRESIVHVNGYLHGTRHTTENVPSGARLFAHCSPGKILSSHAMRYPFDIAVTYALLLLVMCCVVNLTLS
jgi:hypothetical protein